MKLSLLWRPLQEGANKESSVGREAEHNGPQLSENSSDNGGASAWMNWAILREKMIDGKC